MNTDACFSPTILAVSVLIYRVATCFLWIFSQELRVCYFSYNLQLDLHVNSYLSFPWYLIVPTVAQLSDFGWLQCLKGTGVIYVFNTLHVRTTLVTLTSLLIDMCSICCNVKRFAFCSHSVFMYGVTLYSLNLCRHVCTHVVFLWGNIFLG
jgi:hypothetical protein